MTLRPAYDAIVLEHGSHAVILRPSLRAASTLEQSHDGFANLFRRIAEFHTGTVREIILNAATDRKDAAAFLAAMTSLPLRRLVEIVQAPLAALCMGFIPQPAGSSNRSSAKPMPWREAYRELFRHATGWLHWAPETAWNATPTEITEALRGHFDMLKAIHGAKDDEPDMAPSFDPDSQLDRDALNRLRGKGKLR